MSTKKQLRDRWKTEPGRTFIDRLRSLRITNAGHGHKAEELFELLDGLPFRSEVSNGRDFRGANIGAAELCLRESDFSYALLSNFFDCDLSGSKFDFCKAETISIGSIVNNCSFVGARLRNCSFRNSQLLCCNFQDAWLKGTTFKIVDLSGSTFRNANCTGSGFGGSSLLNCDFRNSNLENAVFQDDKIDKSTDIRGTCLLNIHNRDRYDINGNLVAQGVNMRLCTFDQTTQFGRDEGKRNAEIRNSILSILSQRTGAIAERIRSIILENPYDQPDWLNGIVAQIGQEDQAYFDEVLDGAYKDIL